MENIHSYQFRGMGSEITIWFQHEHMAEAEQRLQTAAEMFATAEAQLSRFRPDSELSRLNNQPQRWVPVSDTLWRIINRALELSNETSGLFDPTILPALEAAGYDRSYDLLDELVYPEPFDGADQTDDYLRCDPYQQAIWLPQGMRLDLGGIAKGDTAEQVVQWLNQFGPCLVDAGGDITAGDAPDCYPGWPVGVAAPWGSEFDDDEDILRLWLCHQSLATSGVDYRRWHSPEREFHHIINPRTGQPAVTDLLTVTVLADDACMAEAWATAVLVAGRDAGLWLLQEQGLAAALIDQDSRLLLPQLDGYSVS